MPSKMTDRQQHDWKNTPQRKSMPPYRCQEIDASDVGRNRGQLPRSGEPKQGFAQTNKKWRQRSPVITTGLFAANF